MGVPAATVLGGGAEPPWIPAFVKMLGSPPPVCQTAPPGERALPVGALGFRGRLGPGGRRGAALTRITVFASCLLGRQQIDRAMPNGDRVCASSTSSPSEYQVRPSSPIALEARRPRARRDYGVFLDRSPDAQPEPPVKAT